MTHVVTIAELKKLIPEVFKLEGRDFNNDVKKFLIAIIEAIENSGQWKFVQYIPQSAIFIVRESEMIYRQTTYEQFEPEKEIKAHYSPVKEKNKATKSTDTKNSENKNPEPQKNDKKVTEKQENSSDSDSKLFTDTKLPWN